MEKAKDNSNTKNYTEDEIYAPESRLASGGTSNGPTTPNKGKKKKKIKRRINGRRLYFTPLELTMIILGLLIAIGLIVMFYYMYDSAKHSTRAVPQSGLISNDVDKTWMTRVVNVQAGLPAEYEVATSVVTGYPGVYVDNRITKDTVELINALDKATGEDVALVAGYTSVPAYINQYAAVLNDLVENQGMTETEAANFIIANNIMQLPGADEHSTGLLVNYSVNGSVDPNIVLSSEAYQWLLNNAYKYGFIFRYPEGKDAVTLHTFDPTALRYVGKEAAEAIYNSGVSLEEYNVAQAQAAAEAAAAAAEQAAQEAAQGTATTEDTATQQ